MPTTLHNHFHFGPNRELTELYASVAVKSFAIGLIGIFEPIYIFLFFGSSLWQTLIYFGATVLLFGLISPFGAKLVTKIGIKHAMLVSVPLLLLYFLGLWQIETLGMWFMLLVPLRALYYLAFWPAFHIDFARFADRKKRGRELSYRHSIGLLFGAIAPAIGGLIIVKSGFPALFALVLILLVVSAGVLFFTPDVRESYQDSFEKAFGQLFRKENRPKIVAIGAAGVETVAYDLVWPLFLFLIAISFSQIGLLVSGAILIGLVFRIYLGRLVDRGQGPRLLRTGSVLNALTWPLKLFVISPLTAFLAHTIHQFTRTSAFFPLGVLFYAWTAEKAGERDRRVIINEITINIAKGLTLFALAAIFYFVEPLGVRFVFLVAAIASLALPLFTAGSSAKR